MNLGMGGKCVVKRFHIDPRDIWNIDEIGFQISHSQKENIVFNRTMGPPKQPGCLYRSVSVWTDALHLHWLSIVAHSLMRLSISLFPPSSERPDWYYGFTKKG
jgi:hypothetical protein